jgi:hypothetical protein
MKNTFKWFLYRVHKGMELVTVSEGKCNHEEKLFLL